MSLESAQAIINQDIAEIINEVGIDKFTQLEGSSLWITGPKGLIASYLVDTIAVLNDKHFERPCMVTGLSRSEVTEEARLGHLIDKPEFNFIRHDVIIPFDGFDDFPDFIIHAAGRSTPSHFVNDPIGTIRVNVSALDWLLELSVFSQTVKSFAYFSSSEIYGSPPEWRIPTPETYPGNSPCTGERGCYTEAKKCGEAFCLAYHRKHNIPVKILRPALVYGPGLLLDDGRVLADFMRQGINKTPVTVRDKGQVKRSYCYIKDAIIIFWKIFLDKQTDGQVFNVGNSQEEIRILELACMVHDICGINEPVSTGSVFNTDTSAPDRVCLSMAKFISLFGDIKMTPLREGLKKTIDWNIERRK